MRTLIPTLLLTLLAGSAMAAGQDYSGRYQLADGRILTVTDNDGKLTANIARPAATSQQARFNTARDIPLVAIGPDRFTSPSAQLLITFGQGTQGDIAMVKINEQATQALARR